MSEITSWDASATLMGFGDSDAEFRVSIDSDGTVTISDQTQATGVPELVMGWDAWKAVRDWVKHTSKNAEMR